MARCKLGRPDLVICTGGIGVLPHVSNIEWILDYARANFVTEQPVKNVFVDRQRALREDRIAELLELLHDFVIYAGIMVVRTTKHHDTDAVLALEHVQRFAM